MKKYTLKAKTKKNHCASLLSDKDNSICSWNLFTSTETRWGKILSFLGRRLHVHGFNEEPYY